MVIIIVTFYQNSSCHYPPTNFQLFTMLVIRQKGKDHNGGNKEIKKQSMPNFLKNKHFLPPDTHTYVCVKLEHKSKNNFSLKAKE